MIRHVCPECRQAVSVGDELAGRTIRCPNCQALLPIPTTAVTDASTGPLAPKLPELERLVDQPQPLPEPAAPGPKPKKPRRPAKAILLLCGIPLVVGVGAWLLAGGTWWIILGLVGVGFWVFCFAAFLWEVVRRRPEPLGKLNVLLLFAYAAVVVALWWWVGQFLSESRVYVDNFNDKALRVEVDGRAWTTCEPGSTQMKQLRCGHHHLVVRDAGTGEVLDERDAWVDGRDIAYVLNLLGAQRYHRGTVRYGGLSFGFGKETPEEISDAWFKADVDFLFENPPPTIPVSVPKGQSSVLSSERKTYLTRGSPPPDR
jgi:hypothetical protein